MKQENTIIRRVNEFQEKMASLNFLDPACGSGNFCTESYISLRRLENEAISFKIKSRGGVTFAFDEDDLSPIRVSISQFYGIEINDFAVSVAKTALWIAEHQMMKETAKIVYGMKEDFLPLHTFAHIVEGNALRIDWNDVIHASKLSYIMGNPPFLGTRTMGDNQKQELVEVFGKKWKGARSLDYVAGWYKKIAEYIQNTSILCCLVSTNSITQGEQVPVLWKPLFEEYQIEINFAYKSFIWNSEAIEQAHVHCVIVGFSLKNLKKNKYIYNGFDRVKVENINGYLEDDLSVFVEKHLEPICKNVPQIFLGCTFNDNNNLIMTEEEMNAFIKNNPSIKDFIHPYIMGKDFISRKPRYCFWLKDVSIENIKDCKDLLNRVKAVREFRLACKNKDTVKTADSPMVPSMLRYYANDKCSDYIAIPKVSSQRRKYIPMELISKEVIAGDKIFLMPNSDVFSFGILESKVHMAWTKRFCGRLKSDFSYSSQIVYNTFPWPEATDVQRCTIEKTAQSIIDARDKYINVSLADLYNPDNEWMYPELVKAHEDNDKAVMDAYGFDLNMTESDIVVELMKMYQKLTEEKK